MSNEVKLNAHISETGESLYAVNITVSGHELKGDQTIESGGKILAPYLMICCLQLLANARR
jgi:hypothetical protein